MKRPVILLLFLCLSRLLSAQNSAHYDTDTLIFLAAEDSSLLFYAYPQLRGIKNPDHEIRINKQIKTMLLPDPSVYEKLTKISYAEFLSIKNRSLQKITMHVSYLNDLIVCLCTKITVISPDVPGEAGDLYYNTISIASGNEYYLNNLFLPAIYDTIFAEHTETLTQNAKGEYHLKEHLVNFGLIGDDHCSNCITLEVMVNNLYGPSGPMPVEIKSEELIPLINPDGPLSGLLKNNQQHK